MMKVFVALLAIALAGCSVTEKETPTSPDLSSGTTGNSGFLSQATYDKLRPGTKDQMGLVYINPDAEWSQYSKVYIAPVTMGLGPNDNVSEQDQQMLSSYYYHALERDLAKHFTLVNQPWPGVMTLRVALTDVTTASPCCERFPSYSQRHESSTRSANWQPAATPLSARRRARVRLPTR